jgi:AcrR family transcriptional regulator
MIHRRMKAPDRRRQIMTVAQRLFAQRGYSLTTTAAIATAAGVTEPILYRHFESKRDLFLQLLAEVSTQMIEQLHKVVAQSDEPIKQIELIIFNYPHVSERFAESFVMIDRAMASLGSASGHRDRDVPDVRPLLINHYAAYEQLVASIVRRGQEAGQFRSDVDPLVATWYLIDAAMAWRISHNLGSEVFARPHFIEDLAKLLMDGLLHKPAGKPAAGPGSQ